MGSLSAFFFVPIYRARINYIVVSTCIRVMYAYVMDDISAALCLEACHSSYRRCVCIVAYHLRLKFTHQCREVGHQLIIASRNERSVNGSNHAIHTRISPAHVTLVLSTGLKLTLHRIKGVLSTSAIACQCLRVYLLTQGAVLGRCKADAGIC